MATLDKIKVPIASQSRSKCDLSSTHITSSSFMQLQPAYYYHCIPGTTLKGNINVLSRLAPLAVPTYGRCRINMRYWFVPYRTVFPNFNEFISDTIASNIDYSSLINSSPVVGSLTILNMFLSYTYNGVPLASAISGYSVGDPCDFDLTGTGYELSFHGRRFLKVLYSLGYRFPFDSKNSINFSALGLMCFAKVYYDFYTNQQYHNSSDYLYLGRLFKYNDPTGSLVLSDLDLFNILSFIDTVCYDSGNDVYTNAWDNPMSPNSGNGSLVFAGTDITVNLSDRALVSQDGNGTPVMEMATGSQNIGSQYIHSFLKSLTDYIKRNQLSSADAADRLLSRFGLKLDNSKTNRCTYIGESSVDVDFGAVMQTVNNSPDPLQSNLGDYAGCGLGRGNGSFDFHCDEFGMFLITFSIVPAAALYQGFDPNNLHISKLSFFTPEFDALGCAAIPKGAVYVSPYNTFGNANNYVDTFGFAPRYYEYKQKSSYVTGDLISPLAYAGGDSWHLNREFDDGSFSSNIVNLVHSFNFTRGVDSDTFNRVFSYTGDPQKEIPQVDNFYLVFHIACQGNLPCKSLFDTYDFDSLGEQIKLSSQGAKVN